MSLLAAVSTAVRNALHRDNHAYDPSQVMRELPYEYDTIGKIRDFLLDVAQELSRDVPPVPLNVDKVDQAKCMIDTVIEVEGAIFDEAAKELSGNA